MMSFYNNKRFYNKKGYMDMLKISCFDMGGSVPAMMVNAIADKVIFGFKMMNFALKTMISILK